jgi:hypothetical protein
VPSQISTESAPAGNGEGSSLGHKAAAAIDDRRDTVARGMDSAASTLHERADNLPGGERVASAAHAPASAVQSAADYIRDQDVRGMLSDAGRFVRRNPGATLLIATALGFLIARSLARD